jgi:hypothetical protein
MYFELYLCEHWNIWGYVFQAEAIVFSQTTASDTIDIHCCRPLSFLPFDYSSFALVLSNGVVLVRATPFSLVFLHQHQMNIFSHILQRC